MDGLDDEEMVGDYCFICFDLEAQLQLYNARDILGARKLPAGAILNGACPTCRALLASFDIKLIVYIKYAPTNEHEDISSAQNW